MPGTRPRDTRFWLIKKLFLKIKQRHQSNFGEGVTWGWGGGVNWKKAALKEGVKGTLLPLIFLAQG
jgi:hypothetical protein